MNTFEVNIYQSISKLEQLERLRSELPNDYPYHCVILDPKSKEDKVRVTNFKKFAKISNFWILKQALHATHLLKLLDKMCKYEMDPMSIVEDTEWTRFCPQTDRRTNRRTDRRTRWYQYTPFQLCWRGGIINATLSLHFLSEVWGCLNIKMSSYQ